jgi:hypothetical protein
MRHIPIVAIAVLACLPASLAEAGGQDRPASLEVRIKPTRLGDTMVTGFMVPPPSAGDRFYLDVLAVSGGATTFIDRTNIGTINPETGAFSVRLSTPLEPGRRIAIGKVDGPVLSQMDTFAAIPVLRDELHDGDRIVHGHVEHSVGVAAVRVRVQRSMLEGDSETRGYVQVKSTKELDEDGGFSVTLTEPLKAGQVVRAEAFSDGQAFEQPSQPVTVTDPGSWGRARAYFAAGVVFSKENGDFSQQDLALTFAIDKSWLQKADFTLPGDRAFRQLNRNQGAGSGKWTLRQVNTVFDSRLTSLPVVAPTTNAAAGEDGDGGAATPAEPDFVSSRKGAVMQVGIYAPFYGPQTSWVHDGAVNTLFVAPVMRAGVQTIVGDDSAGTKNLEGQPDDVFNFWSFGFAIGHQRLSGTTNQTPEVISYLHLTWGKAEAFKYQDKDKNVLNPTRLMVEGRLKIPDTPMQIGFDANLGEGHDDLRFIFGTRFDIGALFERLKTFH